VPLGIVATQIALLVREEGAVADADLFEAYEGRFGVRVANPNL